MMLLHAPPVQTTSNLHLMNNGAIHAATGGLDGHLDSGVLTTT